MVGGNESERVGLSQDRTLKKELCCYEDYSSDLRSFLGNSRSTRNGPWTAIAEIDPQYLYLSGIISQSTCEAMQSHLQI
jgi:hypothetical protein